MQEEQQEQAQESYRLALEAAPCGLLLLDEQGRILLANRQCAQLFGYPSAQLLGQSVDLVLPGALPPVQSPAEPNETAKDRRATWRSVEGRASDGRVIPLEMGLTRMHAEWGSQAVVAVMDRSDRGVDGQPVDQVIESAPSGIMLIDPKGCIRLVNRKIEEQFGYRRDELLGRPVDQLVPGLDRGEPVEARAGGSPGSEMPPMGTGRERVGLCKDGTQCPIEIELSPVAMPEGDGLLASVVNISERKRLEEQLRRTERIAELGTLASGMAHEIGTPMNVILGRAEYLLNRTSDPVLTKGLRTIVTQVERITKVMNQLLAFARRRSPQRQTVDIRQIIEESLDMFRERFARKRLAVETQFAADVPTIQADPDQLAQVMMNLIINSLHAMPDQGHLLVAVSAAEGHVKIELGDSGHGIPPEMLSRIFDPFFTTKETGEGTGLGLTVVKGIIEEHDGRISVASQVGRGTVVTMLLPSKAASAQAPPG